MAYDIVLVGGTVVDGSGSAPQRADVGVTGDRVTAICDLSAAQAGERVDCTGRVVAPGFIDIHTHYDPQILWDSDLTPSSWYGVTSVILGNCGFTVAPMRPEGRKTCIETLGNVEAMSVKALEEGISWEFETFDEYLKTIEGRKPLLNVGVMVGHTTLRMYEMGEDTQRAATTAEVAGMRKQLELAMQAGAWGLSTSKSPAQVGAGGRPVASRLAEYSELFELSGALAEAKAGVIQGVGGPGLGIPQWAELARNSGRPVTWCSLHQGVDGGKHWDYSKATAQARSEGADLWAQMTCMPNNAQFMLRTPYILNGVPAFGKIASLPHEERLAILSDKAWQKEAQRQIDANEEKRSFQVRWDRVYLVETTVHHDLVGKTVQAIADSMNRPALEVLVELSKAEDLKTRFKLILFNYDEDEVAKLLQQDSSILGLGDAGAHASQLCDASFPMRMLGRYVRERRDFPLEFAVWRMTGHPASVYGIKERGLVKNGFHADLCVFDPQTIAEGPEKRVFDLPAGADRLIKDPIGIDHTLVNGKFIRRGGQNKPGGQCGRVLRP